MNPDGSDARRLTSEGSTEIQPAYAKDRRRIAFFSDRVPAGIYVMDADGQNAHVVYATPNGEPVEHLSWSPDNARIVFQGRAENYGGFASWVLDIASGSATQLRIDAGSPSWSPDGSTIAFEQIGANQVWLMASDGSNARLLVQGGEDPAWSPSGDRIAFSSFRDGPTNIYSVRADGSELVRVTTSRNVVDTGPSWSPDGDRVAFTRILVVPASGADVWTIGADAKNVVRVTNGPATNGGVSW